MHKTFAVFGAILISSVAAFGATPKISHSAIPCIARDSNAKIVSTLPGATSARVYFRAEQVPTEYYLEMMRRGGEEFWAVLPLPERETASAVYRIVAVGLAGEAISSETMTVPVTDTCAPFALAKEESRFASNLVIGQTIDEPMPLKGWRCEGVDYKINPAGEMRRYDECDKIAPFPIAMKAAAALAGASVGVILLDPDDNEQPISHSMPWGTPKP